MDHARKTSVTTNLDLKIESQKHGRKRKIVTFFTDIVASVVVRGSSLRVGFFVMHSMHPSKRRNSPHSHTSAVYHINDSSCSATTEGP